MKLSVRPMLTVSGGNDVSVACNVRFDHNDNEINVRLADSMVKDGFNTDGLTVGVKNDRFTMVYDVSNHAPRFRMNSHVNVQDKRVDLIYRNDIKGGQSSLECGMDVDDNNRAALIYNLTNFDGPNHKNCAVRWTLRSGDYEISPTYDLGSESLSMEASYNVDSENKLVARYNMNTNMGALEWTNNGGLAGDGELRITASANLANADSAKQMPTILIEKTFDVDT